jgi:hypothetical protein
VSVLGRQTDVVQVDATVRGGLPVLHPIGRSFGLFGQDQEHSRGLFVDDHLSFVIDRRSLIGISGGLALLDELVYPVVALAHEVTTTVGLALHIGMPLGLEVTHRIES